MKIKTAKVLIREYVLARTFCVYYSDNLAMYAQYICAKVALVQKCSQVLNSAICMYNDKYSDKLTITNIDVTSSVRTQIDIEIIIDTHSVDDTDVPINTEIVELITDSLEKQSDPFESYYGLGVNIIFI